MSRAAAVVICMLARLALFSIELRIDCAAFVMTKSAHRHETAQIGDLKHGYSIRCRRYLFQGWLCNLLVLLLLLLPLMLQAFRIAHVAHAVYLFHFTGSKPFSFQTCVYLCMYELCSVTCCAAPWV